MITKKGGVADKAGIKYSPNVWTLTSQLRAANGSNELPRVVISRPRGAGLDLIDEQMEDNAK